MKPNHIRNQKRFYATQQQTDIEVFRSLSENREDVALSHEINEDQPSKEYLWTGKSVTMSIVHQRFESFF